MGAKSRPWYISIEKARFLIQILKGGFTRDEACRMLGIYKSAFEQKIRSDLEFKKRVEKAEDFSQGYSNDTLFHRVIRNEVPKSEIIGLLEKKYGVELRHVEAPSLFTVKLDSLPIDIDDSFTDFRF